MGLTFNFQGQIWNLLYILGQNYLIATKQKKNISIEHLASIVAISFDLGQIS